jgi:hypothetical protein
MFVSSYIVNRFPRLAASVSQKNVTFLARNAPQQMRSKQTAESLHFLKINIQSFVNYQSTAFPTFASLRQWATRGVKQNL